MDKTSKILITGAAGMIGGSLARLLEQKGFSDLLLPAHAELDLTDNRAVQAYFAAARPDYVFHLAARVGGIHANANQPARFVYDNTAMQMNVIEAARAGGVTKLLLPGSACAYPRLAPQPVKETEFLNGAPEPTNIAYAAAKINGIVMAQAYAREYGMRVVIPMPTNGYGIGNNFDPAAAHVIPALMRRFHDARESGAPEAVIWGSGTPVREFIYADDVASAFLFLMEKYDSPDIINVGTGEEIDVLSLAKMIAETAGYEGKIVTDPSRPDGMPRKVLDSGRLRALGWRPAVTLREGIRRMYRHHFGAARMAGRGAGRTAQSA